MLKDVKWTQKRTNFPNLTAFYVSFYVFFRTFATNMTKGLTLKQGNTSKQQNIKYNFIMSTVTIIVIAVVVLLVLWVIGIYNNLVTLRNNRENAFANIDVQLKQRYDLIPNLVNTVKGYAEHEKGVLERVTAARTAAMGATTLNEKIEAENALTSALAGLKVSVEAYPDLKAHQNFLQLQSELADIENKLAAVRRFFNSATKELNTGVQKFPAVLFAGMFGFHQEPMFEVPQEERAAVQKAPEVKF